MNSFPEKAHTTEWIRVKDISVIWPEAQRTVNMNRVAKISKNFDPDVFGVVLLAKPNGIDKYHVIDGQHRLTAVEMLFGNEEKVPCYVTAAETPQEAADTFARTNGYGGTRAAPSAIDKFRVAVTAGYDAETQVHRLLKTMGYRVAADGSDGAISAISACMSVYRQYGLDRLRDALQVIQATWGRKYAATTAHIVQGYALALEDSDIDHGRLVKTVAKNYTPTSIIGAGRNMRDFRRCTMPEAIAELLRETHDRGRTRKKQ